MQAVTPIANTGKRLMLVVLGLLVWAIQEVITAGKLEAGTILQTQGFENLYVHRKDKYVINLDDYVSGQGDQIRVESLSPNIKVEPLLEPHFSITHKTADCDTPIQAVDEDDVVYLKCAEDTLLKVNVTSKEETVLNLEDEGENIYDCQDAVYVEESNRIVVACVANDAKDTNITIFIVNPTKMTKSKFSFVQEKGEVIYPKGSETLQVRVDNTSLAIWSTGSAVKFRLFQVYPGSVMSVGYFSVDKENIKGIFTANEKCSMTGINAINAYVYLTIQCRESERNYYMRCLLNPDKVNVTCDGQYTYFDETIRNADQKVFLLRRSAPAKSLPGDLLYYYKTDRIFMVDYNKKVRQLVFVFKNIELSNINLYEIKAAAMFNKFLYVVVANLKDRVIELLGVSIAKNYYRRTVVMKFKSKEEIYGIYATLVAENLSKSKLAALLIYNSNDRSIVSLDAQSLMTLQVMFNTTSDLMKASDLCTSGLCSIPPFRVSSWSSKSSPKRQGSALIVVPVSIDIYGGESLRYTHHFNLNVMSDESETAEINIPQQFFFYEGEVPTHLPLSKQLIQAYGPQLTISGEGADTFSINYVRKVDLSFSNSTLPALPKSIFDLDEGAFLMVSGKSVVLYETKYSLKNNSGDFKVLHVIQLADNETFHDAICNKGVIAMVTSLGGKALKLTKILRGSKTIETKQWPIDVKLATVNIFDTRIEIDVIHKNRFDEYELFYIKIRSWKDSPLEFNKYPFLPKGLCPVTLEWASRKLPYLFIESKCGDRFEIIELFIDSDREVESPIKSYVIGNRLEKVGTCAFDKYVFVVEYSPNVAVYGIDRTFNLASMRKYFPLSEYGFTKVLTFHCDHLNPYVAALVENSHGKSSIIIYRVEESGDSALRRVHSIIDTGIPTPKSFIVKIDTQPDGVLGYVALYGDGKVYSWEFNLACPEVTIQKEITESIPSLVFQVKSHGSTESQVAKATTRIDIVKQNFEPDFQLVGLIGNHTDITLIHVDDYLRIDGLFLDAYLETSKGLNAAGIESFLERKTLNTDANITDDKTVLGKLVIYKNLAFTWNSTAFMFFENGIPRFDPSTTKYNLTAAGFVFDMTKQDDSATQSKFVFGLTYNEETKVSEVLLVWINKIYTWKFATIRIEDGIHFLRGMLVGPNTFGYIGFNKDDNAIVAGQIQLDMENSLIRKFGDSYTQRMIDTIEVMDCFSAGPKMVAIVKRKLNDIGSIYEFQRDDLFDKVVLIPRADLELFPRAPNQFVEPKLKCTSKYLFENQTFEGLCFLYSKGVQSYASKVVLAANQTQKSRTYLLGKFTNLQGFSNKISCVNYDYIAFVAEKTGLTDILEDFLVLVYKVDPNQPMPFIVLTPAMLGLTKEHLPTLDAGIGLGQNKEPLLFVTANYKNGTSSVQIFNIGTMKIQLSSGGIAKWTPKDTLVMEFLGAKGETIIKKFPLGKLVGGTEFFNNTSNKLLMYAISILGVLGFVLQCVIFSRVLSKIPWLKGQAGTDSDADDLAQDRDVETTVKTPQIADVNPYTRVQARPPKPSLLNPSTTAIINDVDVDLPDHQSHAPLTSSILSSQMATVSGAPAENRFGQANFVLPARKHGGKFFVPGSR